METRASRFKVNRSARSAQMNNFSHVPPGFRFHPTDEELVDYYLRRKVTCRRIDVDVIKDIDLYKIEPWDLQELCRIGTEEQSEWYFFSHKDKKYPTGTRTNRATAAGFWKATGRDKAIYSKHDLIGMRKTLVFYKGRAPNGQKSDWIMHEYRLETDENGTSQEEGWVVCRAFKKRLTAVQKMIEHDSPIWYDDQVSFMPDLDSPKQISHPNLTNYNLNHHYPCKRELNLHYPMPHNHLLQLPLLESPKMLQPSVNCSSMGTYTIDINHGNTSINENYLNPQNYNTNNYGGNSGNTNEVINEQAMDWRVLDKFVASQLSHNEVPKENEYLNGSDLFATSDDTNMLIHDQLDKQEMDHEKASGSNSSCQMNLWK